MAEVVCKCFISIFVFLLEKNPTSPLWFSSNLSPVFLLLRHTILNALLILQKHNQQSYGSSSFLSECVDNSFSLVIILLVRKIKNKEWFQWQLNLCNTLDLFIFPYCASNGWVRDGRFFWTLFVEKLHCILGNIFCIYIYIYKILNSLLTSLV